MAQFSMTCSCGETMSLEAPTRDAAIGMFKGGMTQEALDQHFKEHHAASEPKPTLEQAHGMIQQMVA